MSVVHFTPDKRKAIALNAIHPSKEIRDLSSGGMKIMKKNKIDSKKDKLSKKDSNGIAAEKTGKGNGKGGQGTGKGNSDDEFPPKGKGMTKMKGMMNKMKGKSAVPTLVETAAPSTAATPVASPKTISPIVFETESPMVTYNPSPAVVDTETPSITLLPNSMTASPILLQPSAQPILVSPTNFAFIGISNVLVRYDLLNSGAGNVTLNQTMEAIDLTCDYLQNEAIVPLGALQFACIWFLPRFDEDGMTFFPLEITYAGTAAFPSEAINTTNISTEVLDASIISAMTPPMVGNLTEMFMTELPSENPFSRTEEIYAVV